MAHNILEKKVIASYQSWTAPVIPSFEVYSDSNYPDTNYVEPSTANQRYVGGSGASDGNDGSQGSPWATLEYALQQLCASSSWYCLNINGDLTVTTATNLKSLSNIGPGSSSQYAIIRKTPSLQTNPTVTLNATISVDGQSYWLWHDFNVTSATNSFFMGQDLSMSHHTMRNINGTYTGNGGDNVSIFRTQNGNLDYWGVFNCTFTGNGESNMHQNSAGIVGFRHVNLRWENNVITGFPRPLYYKHSNRDADGSPAVYIRNNYVSEANGLGCFFAGRVNGGTWEISNNIFAGNVQISNGGGGDQPDGISILHNTFAKDLLIERGNNPVQNCVVRNNIIMDDLELLRYGTDVNTNTSDYNLYGSDIFYQSDQNTLITWQSNSVPANQDQNSIAGLPTFVNGSLSAPSHYELVNGSLGINASETSTNLGADTDKVGVF